MEYLDERSRYESGCLSRESEQILAVAVMQRLFNMEETENE